MGKARFYIEGKEVELYEDEEITTTHAVSDIGDLNNRSGSYSNTFEFPTTAKNKAIFENIHVHNSTSRIPYKLLSCRIDNGGVTLEGLGRLTSTGGAFSFQFVAGNADLYKAIEGKKLSDLDLSDLNHEWTRAIIISSFANTSGYIYPMIDYNSDSPNAYISKTSGIDSRLLSPAIFVHTLFDRIISEAGFTKSGKIFDLPLYKQLVLPFSNSTIGENTDQWVLDREIIVSKNIEQQVFQTIDTRITFPVRTKDVFNFWDISGVMTGNPGPPHPPPAYADNFLYLYGEAFAGTINASLTIEKTSTITGKIGLYKEVGGFANRVLIEEKEITTNGIQTIDFIHDFDYNGVPGTRYYLLCSHNVGTGQGNLKIKSGTFSITEVERRKRFTHNLLAKDFVTDVSQSDLLFQVMLMFGLIPIIDQRRRHVKFVQFKDIISNKSKALDWSNKVDLSEKPSVTYHPKYAQKNIFRYKADATVNEALATGEFKLNNQALEPEKTAVSMPFAFSETVKRNYGRDYIQIPIREAGAIKNKVGPRIIRLRKETGAVTLFEQTTAGSTLITSTIPFTDMVGLSPSELIQANYLELINTLENYHEVKALLRINEVDISQLDFEIPVFIRQIGDSFGAYYYVNEIEQFKHTSTESTYVQLVRI